VVATGACGSAKDDGRGAAASATGDADATVTLVDLSFSPSAITVSVGDVVAWVWKDGRVQHDVVFDDGPSSPKQRNGKWQRAFDRPGTYEYVCTLHPNMTGRVLVE